MMTKNLPSIFRVGILSILFLTFSQFADSQVMVTEGFEGATFPPSNWTRINNGTGKNWESSTLGTFSDGPYTANTGTGCMVLEYNSTAAANTWMISPVLALTSGSNYNITFAYRIRSGTYPEKMKVTIGNAATVAAQTTTLWDNNGGANLTNASYATALIAYTATSTGNFYVGFNCYSDADQWAMQVDDIVIEKVNPCSGTPTAGSAASSLNYICTAGNVNLSLTGSSTTTGLTYQWQSSPTGAGTFTNIGSSSSSPAYTASVSSSTDFRCIVTCTAGGGTANSAITTVVLGSIPANDAVCDAITLVLDGAEHCGNTSCATAVGDPTFSSSTANNTVWYKYTPTVTGVINIEMSRPAGVTNGFIYAWTGVYTATGACPTLTLTEVTPAPNPYDLTTNPTVTVATGSLTAGTTYYFMIDGFSGSLGAYCIKIKTAPSAPTSCATNSLPANNATNVSFEPNIKFKWNAVSGATSYDFYFSTTNPPTTLLGAAGADSVNITGGVANTTYYWYVVPKNLGGAATGCTSSITSFTTGFPLPITLANFSGVREAGNNILNWSTANETNNKGFELERSANGEKFSSIASIASKAENGNSSSVLYYSYTDEKPLTGTNYYRLRQIDFNGKESYSNIVVLKSASIVKAEISRVYPNPVEAQLNLVLNTPSSEKVQIRITDLVGKVISEKVLQTNQGDNNVQFNTSNLSRGTYLIKVYSSSNSEMSTQKFIKQ